MDCLWAGNRKRPKREKQAIQSLRYDLREKFVYCNAKGIVKVKATDDAPDGNRF